MKSKRKRRIKLRSKRINKKIGKENLIIIQIKKNLKKKRQILKREEIK